MAANMSSSAAPFGATATYRFVKSVVEGANALRNWNDGRVTRKALSHLSDRALDDIGLCRGDVDLIGR